MSHFQPTDRQGLLNQHVNQGFDAALSAGGQRTLQQALSGMQNAYQPGNSSFFSIRIECLEGGYIVEATGETKRHLVTSRDHLVELLGKLVPRLTPETEEKRW